MNKFLPIGVVCAIAMAFIVGVLLMRPPQPTPTPNLTLSEEAEEKPTLVIITLGESVEYSEDLLVTFTGAMFTDELLVDDGVWTAPEGYIFFLVNVTFENVGTKDFSYSWNSTELPLPIYPSRYFDAVLVADGQEFEIRGTKFSIYEIKVGETINTYIFFEIPTGLTPVELRIYKHGEVAWILKFS